MRDRSLATDLEEAAAQAQALADQEVAEEDDTVPAGFAAASRDTSRAAELAAEGEAEAAASLLGHRASTGIDHAERTFGTPISG